MLRQNELQRLLLFAAAVLALSFVARVYAPALRGAFIWDDHHLVEQSSPYQHAPLGELLTRPYWPQSPFADARTPYYRPVVLLSYRFDRALGGAPAEFHFTNVALHLLTCISLAIVAVRAGATIPAAIVASTFWGAFPRLTEAVAWIAGRTDVLAAFFGFAALAIWPETSPAPRERSPASTWARSLLGGLLLLLACASKEVALAFAAAMIFTVVLRRGSWPRAAIAIGLPLLTYFALRFRAFATLEVPASRELGIERRGATVLEAIERYTEMTLDPFHSRTSIGMLGEVDGTRAALGAVITLAALLGIVLAVRRGTFGARLAMVLGLFAIAPVIQIIPLPLTSAVVADRLLYVPLGAVAIGLALLGSGRPRAFGAAALVLAIIIGGATHARASDYLEETAFWTVAAENSHPHNTAARTSLARWLDASGEPEAACPIYEQSLAILTEQHLESRPPHRRARENLASCWARVGRYEDAVRMSRQLVNDFPDMARLFLALGFAELHVREFERAAIAFETASRLEGGKLARYVVSNAELATIRADAARFDELDRLAKARHLGDLGRAIDSAEAYFAIAIDPNESVKARQVSAAYLMEEGPYTLAIEALAVVPTSELGWATRTEQIWKRRRAAHRGLEAVRDRVDALMH